MEGGAQRKIRGGEISCPCSLGPSRRDSRGLDVSVHCFAVEVYRGHFCYVVWRQNIDLPHCDGISHRWAYAEKIHFTGE